MKEWKKPEIQNLTLQATKEEEAQPYFYFPWVPACSDSANYSGDDCPKFWRPCKYYKCGECTAPAGPAVVS